MINRRHLVGGLLALGCCPSAAGTEERPVLHIGCFTDQGTGGVASYEQSTGNSDYDATVRQALTSVETAIGRPIGCDLLFSEENQACYDPGARALVFGTKLLDELQGPDFGLKVTCLAAHETAHVFQAEDAYFNMSLSDPTVRRYELMADWFAGACLAFIASGSRPLDRKLISDKEPSVKAAFRLMFSKGDEHFRSKNHHGTSTERMQEVESGWTNAFEIAGGAPSGDISLDILDRARFGAVK